MNHKLFSILSGFCILSTAIGHAQVVQLPTYRVFSVGTTVSVPDGGAAYLGGVTRGSWSSSSRGVPGLSQVPGLNRLFTNRTSASSISSSHAYATATIIDHAEIDRVLLAEAATRRGESTGPSQTDRRAAYLSEFVARRPELSVSPPPITGSVESVDVAARTMDACTKYEAEMAVHLQRAQAAEAAGHLGSARCNYKVLLRRGSDQQKQLAALRLTAMETSTPRDKLAIRGH
ncbi:MAG: hypothetical protein H6822_17120 [Planctomycetaceae bacterium]|nr:hypothetical protein [Planctomycetales bacterium]MCB9923907.1 hypothetical protein [Planctomycetaceae bacterium]